MKATKWILAILAVAFCTFAACNSDNKDDEPEFVTPEDDPENDPNGSESEPDISNLLGIWYDVENIIYDFKSNGKITIFEEDISKNYTSHGTYQYDPKTNEIFIEAVFDDGFKERYDGTFEILDTSPLTAKFSYIWQEYDAEKGKWSGGEYIENTLTKK